MDYSTILEDLRHPTETEFFIGSFVKKIPLIPILPSDVDTRPLMIITDFTTIGLADAAIIVFDSDTDSSQTLSTTTILLSELELIENVNKHTAKFCKYKNLYIQVVGRIHSLYKCIYVLDDELQLDLISDYLVTELQVADVSVLGLQTLDLNVPKNLSVIPIIAISILPATPITTIAVNDVIRFYAILSPDITTQRDVDWTKSVVYGSGDATLTIDTNTQICDVEFTQAGNVTIIATSIDNPDLSYSLTLNVE